MTGEAAEQLIRRAERAWLESTFDRLWPLPRSLTGDGVRQTHDVLAETMALERIEVASGTQVFDWTVPDEWRVNDAYVVGPTGERVVDYGSSNLHLLGYSVAFRGRLTRAELDRHLYSLPERPDAVPYATSYYAPRWGFCVAQRVRDALPEGEYEVVVDTETSSGSMTLSECVLPGTSGREVLLSTYTCHPSLANNELSGPLVAAALYARLARWPTRRLGYRFVLAPETIGAITYLALRGEHLQARLDAGYVLTCLGDRAALTYKRSRQGSSLADRAAQASLPGFGEVRWHDFSPMGSDERQYCSPGFDLPVGSVMRSMYGTYPEYHTSDDNRDFVSFDHIQASVDACEALCLTLDQGGAVYRNLLPFGEPQLGRRGLYPDLTMGPANVGAGEAIFWVLNLSDSQHDLLAISERSGVDLATLHDAAQRCLAAGLLELVG